MKIKQTAKLVKLPKKDVKKVCAYCEHPKINHWMNYGCNITDCPCYKFTPQLPSKKTKIKAKKVLLAKEKTSKEATTIVKPRKFIYYASKLRPQQPYVKCPSCGAEQMQFELDTFGCWQCWQCGEKTPQNGKSNKKVNRALPQEKEDWIKEKLKEFDKIKIEYGLEPRTGCDYPKLDDYIEKIKVFIRQLLKEAYAKDTL